MFSLKKFMIATCVPIALTAGGIITASPAQASITACDPNWSWYTITSRTTYDQVDAGDYRVYRAPTTTSVHVSSNFTATSAANATTTTTKGLNASASVGVGIFNGTAGYSASNANAMEVSHTYTASVTTDVTIPAGRSMVQYVGHGVTRAYIEQRRCDSRGATYSITWSGVVTGPVYPVNGWEDCAYTTLC